MKDSQPFFELDMLLPSENKKKALIVKYDGEEPSTNDSMFTN